MSSAVDYESVFKALAIPVAVLTPDAVIVAVNEAYLTMTRRTEADLIGRCVLSAFTFNPDADDPPALRGDELTRESLARALATGEQVRTPVQRYDIETPGHPGEFEERYLSGVTVPVLGQDGEVKLLILQGEDITDFLRQLRLCGEHGVGGLRARLEEMETDVYARARDLQDLNGRLERAYRKQCETTSALHEAVERQRRLVFDLSHDLRNPIAGLLAKLDVALSDSGADLRQSLRRLVRDAERLNAIVADMLELARLETAIPGACEPFDLGRLVLDELQRQPLTARVGPRVDPGVTVRACPVRIARLLGNLLSNADRHAASIVEVVVTARPPDAVLEVVDDGGGIAPRDRERIFERLVRLDDARRLDPQGSGLGLSIAREIAQSFGGRLYADDSPKGARLVLRLPLASSQDPEESAPADRPGRPAAP
ncbi:sensor histidine kinase [Microbispora sp. ATCC PTA-5024]|uniref:sensor histidine kinase n=1 Tax=Microbispora sp. ATCC PTA-5024 TaxID=316330 RepID=UPI0012ECE7F1|nr:PAS domain-containing sensor histidine kinase [Microbispora sp. ATCC PTA-5024]